MSPDEDCEMVSDPSKLKDTGQHSALPHQHCISLLAIVIENGKTLKTKRKFLNYLNPQTSGRENSSKYYYLTVLEY